MRMEGVDEIDSLEFTSGGLAAMLLISGVLKIAQPDQFLEFAAALSEGRAVPVAARVVPWLELLVGLSLLTPMHRASAFAAGVLSTAFVAAAARGMKLPTHACGCFGPLDSATPPWLTLIRAVLVMAVAWVSFGGLVRRDVGLDTRSIILGVLAGTAVAASFVLIGQLVALRRDTRAAKAAHS